MNTEYELQHETARIDLQMRTAKAMQSVEREAHYGGCYLRSYLRAAVDYYIATLPFPELVRW